MARKDNLEVMNTRNPPHHLSLRIRKRVALIGSNVNGVLQGLIGAVVAVVVAADWE